MGRPTIVCVANEIFALETARVVHTDCGLVEYSAAGVGDPILYFHGAGITGDVMLSVEASLIEEGFRLIVPNRPGYGQTPLAPYPSTAACADLAAALLDSLFVAHASVMGSSAGAAFAAKFAIRHPDRVNSLVLLCPQLHRWDEKRWLPQASGWTLPILQRPWLRSILLKLYRMQLRRMPVAQLLKMEAGERCADVAHDPASHAFGATTLAAMNHATQFAGFENDFQLFTDEDSISVHDSLAVPTLVIHDPHDPVAPVDHVDWFTCRFPGCERISVHAGGHLVWIGLEAGVMHQKRVRFLKEHAGRSLREQRRRSDRQADR